MVLNLTLVISKFGSVILQEQAKEPASLVDYCSRSLDNPKQVYDTMAHGASGCHMSSLVIKAVSLRVTLYNKD